MFKVKGNQFVGLSGTAVKRVDYDSFGNIISDSNSGFAVPFGFAGGLHDRDAGLVRFGFRDYDPNVGRWTAKDPIFFLGGDTDLYGYCLSNPVGVIDTSGLDAELFLYRPFGLLIGRDDDGNSIIIPITENGTSTIPGDPYGVGGPIPPGTYNVNPRPSHLNHPGRPTISSSGQNWNTILTPKRTLRHGAQIHPGTRSEGCLLTEPGTHDYQNLREFLEDEYNDGGVKLYVIEGDNPC